VAGKAESARKQNYDTRRLSSVFESTGSERWIVFNSLIFVLEPLDYCLGVLVQVITLRSTLFEPMCSDYMCRLLKHMGVNVIWLKCCVICQILCEPVSSV